MPKLQNLLKRRPESPPLDEEGRARLDQRLASLRTSTETDEGGAAPDSQNGATSPSAKDAAVEAAAKAAEDAAAQRRASASRAAAEYRAAAEQRAAAERAEAERAGAERAEAERAAAERAEAERRAARERAAAAAAAVERTVAERHAAELRAEAERAAQEQRAAEKIAAEWAAAAEQRAAAERHAAEQHAAELRAAEQRAAQKRADEQAAAEQRAAQQRAAEEAAAAKRAAEQAARDRRAEEQRAAKQAAADRRAAEQAAAEQRVIERQATERAAAEGRAAAQRAAQEAAAERRAAQQRAAEEAAAAKRAAAQAAAEQRAADRLAARQAEAERRAAQQQADAARPPVLARLLGRSRPERGTAAPEAAVAAAAEAPKQDRAAPVGKTSAAGAAAPAKAATEGTAKASAKAPAQKAATLQAVVDVTRPPKAVAPSPVAPAPAKPVAGTPARTGLPVRVTKPGRRVAAVVSCPYCADALPSVPTGNLRCPRCRQRIVVRRVGDRTVLLTEAALPVFVAQRRQAVHAPRWTRERDRWLELAKKGGAASDRVARILRDPLSDELVARARALYVSTVEGAARLARRDRRWDEATRLSLDLALALYKIARSPRPVPPEIVRFHREGLNATLRGIGEIAKSVELRAGTCCEACRADDGRAARITDELRTPTLPHEACPNGLCRCRWYLADRDRTIVTSLLKRQTRPPRPRRPATQS